MPELTLPPAVDPRLLLPLILVAEAVVGELRWLWRVLPHPVAAMGALVGALERRLNREKRSAAARLWRGALVTVLVTGLFAGLGWAVAAGLARMPYGWVLEVAIAVTLFAQRSLYRHVRDVAVALGTGGLAAGRAAVAHIVGRDPAQLDEAGVARAAIESCAENYSDGVVAPAFWYALAGLPGLFAYKAINTMDSMIGHRTPRYLAFGMTAARLDDAVNWIPARIAGLFLVLAALFTPTANPWRAAATMLRDAGKHRSPNAGWPEAAAAGGLGLALAGPRRYREETADDPWIGAGRARSTAGDIRRMLYLYTVGCLVNLLACLGFAALVLMPAG